MIEYINKSLEHLDKKDLFFTSFKMPSKKLEVSIKGIGDLDYPLSQKMIKILIKESNLASFGWRDQTVIDTKVRNVWEIPAKQIKFSKESITEIIQPSLEKIKSDLGLDDRGKLSVQLHNLLIYEKGQFFDSHQDTEKVDGMVGTMVVLLPSGFKGGSLVIDHQGNKKTFSPSKKLDGQLNIIAFYADCFHKITKVTSGYRVALTYNLFFKSDNHLISKENNPKLVSAIREYFSKINPSEEHRSIAKHPHWLVVLLNHQYSQKNLAWSQLKGTDRKKAKQCLAAADELGMDVHLALADIHESWSAEEEFSGYYRRGRFYDEGEDRKDTENIKVVELFDQDYSLTNWIERSGKKSKLREHTVPNKMFTWTKAHNNLKPFESSYEGYMGNYGNTMDYWYHRAALVLWPKEIREESLFVVDPSIILKEVKATLLRDLNSGISLTKKILPHKGLLRRIEPARIISVLEVACLSQNKKIAEQLLSEFDLSIISKKNSRHLLGLICAYGEDWFIDILKKLRSMSKHSYSEKISGLNKICESLIEYPKVTHWILNQQLSLFLNENNRSEKNERLTEIEKNRSSSLKRLHELILSISTVQDSCFLDLLLRHLLDLKRVYLPENIAELVLSVLGDPFFKSFKKNLSKHAVIKLDDFVSQKRQHGDLSISDKVPCQCDDCKILKVFFKSKDGELIWPLAMHRRQHIHDVINGMSIDVTHITKRQGSPHKLILSKTKSYFTKEESRRAECKKYLEAMTLN